MFRFILVAVVGLLSSNSVLTTATAAETYFSAGKAGVESIGSAEFDNLYVRSAP